MSDSRLISLGKYASYWFHKTPKRMLHSLCYYKFAAKMIGKDKRVLDIGCNEGFGTYVLFKECGYVKGIDFDDEAVSKAIANFAEDNLVFSNEDILQSPNSDKWDAITTFDVIEHIFPQNLPIFFKALTDSLAMHGVVIIGTPSLISQQFANEVSKNGHVNVYDPERLEKEMRDYFDCVYVFAVNDEVVHTGFLPLAHYLIGIGAKKKSDIISSFG